MSLDEFSAAGDDGRDAAGVDAPSTRELADALDVNPEHLAVFVEFHPDPDPVAVLGWAVADPSLEPEVAAWLAAREGGET